MQVILFLLLAIHIIICIGVGIMIRIGRLKIDWSMFVIMLLIPGIGFLMVFVQYFYDYRKKRGKRRIGIEKLKVESVKYHKIQIDDDSHQNITVPLEEAMIMNEELIRRNLMLDILQRNPENNIDLLQKASMTYDTEISHYATVTMMNIQGEYEKEFHSAEEEYNKHSKDETILRNYREILKKYIHSGLITGSILKIYEQKLDEVLLKLLEINENKHNDWIDWLENSIRLGKYEEFEEKIESVLEKWPMDEKLYMLYGQYAYSIRNRQLLDQILNWIDTKQIYLSKDGKQWKDFWERGNN